MQTEYSVKIITSLLVTTLISLSFFAATVNAQETASFNLPGSSNSYAPGELIVQFKTKPRQLFGPYVPESTGMGSVSSLNRQHGVDAMQKVLKKELPTAAQGNITSAAER